MPDDRHIDARQLHERDYYAWTVDQAKLLRELAQGGLETPLDLENLAEEVADLGKSERSDLQSYVRNVIEHLLKLEYSHSFVAHGEAVSLPTVCRYRLEEILDEEWEPKNRHDIVDPLID